jgi:hypothetical protein
VKQSKQLQIDDLLHKLDEKEGELSRVVDEKEQELAIMQEGMDTTLQQMSELQQVCICGYPSRANLLTYLDQQREGETDTAFTAQVDTLILDHRKQLNEIIGQSSSLLRPQSLTLNSSLCFRFHFASLCSKGG